MAKEKQTCENSTGSRLRENVSKIFDCFLIVSKQADYNSDVSLDYQFPEDFDNEEILQQSLLFCFPFEFPEATMSTFKDRANHFTFILTDIEGKHRFGFCKLTNAGTKCYCILSFVPWFEIFYKVLNYSHELYSQIKELGSMLKNLYSQQIPEANEIVTVDKNFVFKTPDASVLQSIPESRNLSEYYAAVNHGFMMDVFASLMVERRIIFTSSSLSVLTSCIHGAESLLRPLHWQHIYIPVMPPHLIDYCLAPMPYLIGVHSSLMGRVHEMIDGDDDIIIADIDKENIETVHKDVERLPNDTISFLKSLLKKQTVAVGTNLSMAFLRTQARLIGHYRNGLKLKPGEPITFDESSFIESYKSNTEKEFARALIQLQSFKQFVDGRLDLLNAGIGFRDTFENEVNMIDAADYEKETYKEWLNVAKSKRAPKGSAVKLNSSKLFITKKGGNELITQFKRAKGTMKVARQSIRDAVKQQQQSHPSVTRKKSLAEITHRIRPVRPPSIEHNVDHKEKARTQDRKPPRLPPRSHSIPNKLYRRSRLRLRITSQCGELNIASDLDEGVRPKSDSVLSDAYTGVDVNLMDDWESAVKQITVKNSPTYTSNEPDLLLKFSDVDNFPASEKPSISETSRDERHSFKIHRSSHVNNRPNLPLKNVAYATYSSDELTPSPEHILDEIMPSRAESAQATEETALSTATKDLQGLNMFNATNTTTQATNKSGWVVFDDVRDQTTNTFSSNNDVTNNFEDFQKQSSIPTVQILKPSNQPVESSSIRHPGKLTSEKLKPFKTDTVTPLLTSGTDIQQIVGSVGNKTSYFDELQSLSFPPSNTNDALFPPHSNSSKHVKSSTNPFINNNTTTNYTDTFRKSNIPKNSNGHNMATPKRIGTVWKDTRAENSCGNGDLIRSQSVRLRSNDNELFSDLLGSWKAREGL